MMRSRGLLIFEALFCGGRDIHPCAMFESWCVGLGAGLPFAIIGVQTLSQHLFMTHGALGPLACGYI